MGKRGNGEGSVFQSGGAWFATFPTGLRPDGTVVVKRFRAKTRAEAVKRRDAARALWAAGHDVGADKERQTVGAFLARWLEQAARGPQTMQMYRAIARLHVAPETKLPHSIGHLALRRLQTTDLRRLYDALADRPALAQKTHHLIHRVLKDAVRWGDATRNVADLLDAPAYRAPELHPPSEEMIQTFLDRAEEEQDRFLPLWAFLAMTGCRPGEALGAEWRELDRGEWLVQRSRATHIAPMILPVKTRHARRVALGDRCAAVLREHRKRQLAAIARRGEQWTDHGLVFTNRDGGPLQWTNVRRAYYRAMVRARLADDQDKPRFAPYVFFRHAHVTIGLSNGVPVQDMAFRTGHSIEVLMRHYAHRIRARDEDAVARFERAIGPKQVDRDEDAAAADERV